MTKNLYLLRHAEAQEKQADQKDIERKLNPIGLQNSSRMGINLSHKDLSLDMLLCSPAVRAKETAVLVAEQIGYDTNRIHINPDIYEASVRIMLQLLNQLKNEWHNVLFIGHNPSFSYLSEYLTGEEIGFLSTCGIVHVRFDIVEWSQVSQATGHLIAYEYPSMLNF